MKTTILIALLCATAALAQTPPDGQEKLDQAKAQVDTANKKKAEAMKKADAADAEYRKLQGRIELTAEQANEMLKLLNQWQAEIIIARVTLPEQFEAARKRSADNLQKFADQYKARLAELKQASNATNCEGLAADQKWTGCKDPSPSSGK